MRILVINWQDRENPQAGGAELHLHEIFGRLASRGHAVTLLCGGWPGADPRTRLDGIEVHRTGTRATFALHAAPYFRRTMAAGHFDVIVEDINKVPLLTPWWPGRRAPVVALIPHLFGSTAFEELATPLAAVVWLAERPIPLAYREAAFEAISESTADDLVERGIDRDRIRIIYPGVDAQRLTPDPSRREPTPLFVYLGRLKRYKRVDLIIRAFAGLAHPTARLAIAGSGDARPELESLARSLDLGSRVQFLGFISEDDKRTLLRRAWSVIFTSPKEGWGITNLEAAACGTPVIASNSPGIRESVRDGETGLLVRHGDGPALSAALQQLAGSPGLVAAMGARGRTFAETFTWTRAAEQTEAHLHAVATEQGAR